MEKENRFDKFGLETKILQAIQSLEWSEPTFIQKTAVPIILTEQDVFLVAPTGSGKKVSFIIPILHVLSSAETKSNDQNSAIIIEPTIDACNRTKTVRYYT